MRSGMKKALRIALTCVSVLMAQQAIGQDVELLIKHKTVSRGVDGITRTSEFSERMSRAKDNLWVSRVIPSDVHSEAEHAKGGKAHKHLDVATAARWISRDAAGKAQLKLIPPHGKVVVSVNKGDYDSVGFDGSWDNAWGLIDAGTLKRMKPGPTSNDLTTYTMAEKGRSLKVIWNSRLKLPALVESTDKTSQRHTAIQVLEIAPLRPWTGVQGFSSKEYSDYLD